MILSTQRRDRHAGASRRGVLLLVVLSMLTLFLMLGAAYLLAATRAREAARAHSRLTCGGDEARIPRARLLDTVLLKVLLGGGPAQVATGTSPPTVTFESLLADRYGAAGTTSGTISGVTLSGAVATGTLVLAGSPMQPADLNGRLLTISEPGRPVSTHRIVRAAAAGAVTNQAGNSFTLVFAAAAGNTVLGRLRREQSIPRPRRSGDDDRLIHGQPGLLPRRGCDARLRQRRRWRARRPVSRRRPAGGRRRPRQHRARAGLDPRRRPRRPVQRQCPRRPAAHHLHGFKLQRLDHGRGDRLGPAGERLRSGRDQRGEDVSHGDAQHRIGGEPAAVHGRRRAEIPAGRRAAPTRSSRSPSTMACRRCGGRARRRSTGGATGREPIRCRAGSSTRPPTCMGA